MSGAGRGTMRPTPCTIRGLAPGVVRMAYPLRVAATPGTTRPDYCDCGYTQREGVR